ncbi:hypothetical protein OPV22_026806 [Ensete ventricosum]|uniref:Uncharacterized protein n=1 Tax=Ensete ventricosum TaxID=4639 RepID=A0AAV8PYN5_ENSVE|nr:hypothetical protein OPV22_026806 [Ensete ventricosum]
MLVDPASPRTVVRSRAAGPAAALRNSGNKGGSIRRPSFVVWAIGGRRILPDLAYAVKTPGCRLLRVLLLIPRLRGPSVELPFLEAYRGGVKNEALS